MENNDDFFGEEVTVGHGDQGMMPFQQEASSNVAVPSYARPNDQRKYQLSGLNNTNEV